MEPNYSLQIPNYAFEPVIQVPGWNKLVALDLLINGLATGLFLVAAIFQLARPDLVTPLVKAAYPAALALIIIDLLCLIIDIGDPLRFHHMLRVIKLRSPMSVGNWFLTSFAFTLTVITVINLLPADWLSPALPRLIVILGLVPALGSAVYKGILLSITAQPGWKDARWLAAYLSNSALLLGCAELLLISILMNYPDTTAILSLSLIVLLVLNLLPLGLLVNDLRPTLVHLYTPWQIRTIGVLLFGAGKLLPLFLLIFTKIPLFLFITAGCIFLESLIIRFVVVRLPHASA